MHFGRRLVLANADQLLVTLKSLSPQEWDSVKACADKTNRAELVTAREAMNIIGVEAAHELLVRISPELHVQDGGPVWEIIAQAVLAAAAWGRLTSEERRVLTACLRACDSVNRLLSSWWPDDSSRG